MTAGVPGLLGRAANGAGDGPPGDEDALRRLLQGAVEDLEPSKGALDHLRIAVPARRARKRQALVGAAAAVLLIGTAVPAFLHVAAAQDLAGRRGIAASAEQQARGTEGMGKGTVGTDQDSEEPSGRQSQASPDPGVPPEPNAGRSTTSGGAVENSDGPQKTFGDGLPNCAADQLGVTAVKDAPRADGTVYGSFRVSNKSDTECAVDGGGNVGFAAEGAANPARISVVQHTAGDPATGLPDTKQDVRAVALAPNTAYEVQFAFVPSATCPTEGGGDPTPDPTVSEGTGQPPAESTDASGGMAHPDTTGMDAQLLRDGDGGATEDGSVSVSHTPEPGAPVAETTIANACAGTIYKTGPVGAPSA